MITQDAPIFYDRGRLIPPLSFRYFHSRKGVQDIELGYDSDCPKSCCFLSSLQPFKITIMFYCP